MNKDSLVYIVLPVYNWEKYFLEQLMSIYYQDYKNWYLIIINDWSTDKSELIARDFISHYNLYDKVKIIDKDNGWLNSAITRWFEEIKNICEIHAVDGFVCYCDCDDVRTRKKISSQVEYMVRNKDCGLSSHDLSVIDENWVVKECSKMKKFKYKENKDFWVISTMGHFMTATAMMFRIECIDDILPMPLWKNMNQDWWTALILSFLWWKIGYIDSALWYYRVWHMSKYTLLSKNKKNISDRYVKQLKFLQNRFPNVDLSSIISYKEDIWWKNFKNRMEIYVYTLFKHPKIFFIQLKLFLKVKAKFRLFKL